MIRAVIFDFDGTLTELTLDFSFMRAELEKTILAYLPSVNLDDLRGLYMLEAICRVERDLGAKGAAFRKKAFALLRDMEVQAAAGKELYPFARDVLGVLKQMGVKSGIITRNCSSAVRSVFPDLDEYVEVLVSREEVTRVKPHPDHLLVALRLLHVEPSEALLVGDHPTDVQTGIAAGIRTVAVLSGGVGRRQFEACGAHLIMDDIRGIVAFL